ncbi:hypothetical protein AX13_04725 [Comamonas aquatica DA1877]|uniref:Inovirus Gp2 family protein n=1 Tax=Comamonas aquatica DA1877 TaxID=1457173 RepID=A0A014NZT6_9BURK|nr:hypothetical protein AX13_04725 [Comamonas aquatica DA1877]
MVDEVGTQILQEKDRGVWSCLDINPMVAGIIETTCAFLLKKGSQDGGAENCVLLGMGMPEFLTLNDCELQLAQSAFNELALALRKIILNKGMRDAVKNYRKNSTKRYGQVMKVTRKAWKKFSKILLIRLDWGLLHSIPDLRAKFKDQEDFEDQLMEVTKYRDAMLELLKKRYGSDLAFYFWKIEFGAQRGLHLHWMIGLNGSKHQYRIRAARAIAEMWKTVIDNENSYIWNVNAIQSKGEPILRVIDYHDPQLWEIVGVYADYLTKVDYFLKLRMPGNMHSFGGTQLRNESCKKRGPQRSKAMTEADIKQVRGPQGGRKVKGEKA